MSEESIPLMTSYRSPHNGRRSFAMTSDVPRYSAQVYNAVLRRNRISFTTGRITILLMLQFEAVGSVTGLGEAPCDIFIIVFQMEDDEVERGADYFRIETFRPCGDADIQECVVIFGNAVLEMEWAAFSCSRKRMKVLRAGPTGATPRWMRSRVYMLLSVMTAATRRWLPAGMAVMKATESFSSWVSLRWKKFRSLSFMYFRRCRLLRFCRD